MATLSRPWVTDTLDSDRSASDIGFGEDWVGTEHYRSSRCIVCKGARMLCGKSRCPITVRFYSRLKIDELLSLSDISGTSPPGVFVGRIGYPYVSVGPLVPPLTGDTGMLDTPEWWLGKTIDEIVGFRSMLVRGKHRVHVKDVERGKYSDLILELSLAEKPTDVELEFSRRPRISLVLNDEIQPLGPSAPMKDMRVANVKADKQLERVHFDGDLKASESVYSLYEHDVLVSKIQKAFSVGALGLRKRRRFVPTRWSITAVDSILSTHLNRKVKNFPSIDEYRIYESNYLDNRFEVLMLPRKWSYESIETWYPGTVWNPRGSTRQIFSDWENYGGRTTYATIGGCYYAARLAVNEHLVKERKQARVIILREALPGYIMPVGVWHVRENVRNAMRQKPKKFDSLEQVLRHIGGRFGTKLEDWIGNSALLRDELGQRRISDFTPKAG